MIKVNTSHPTYFQQVNYYNKNFSKHSYFQNTQDTCSFSGIRSLTINGKSNARVNKITSSPDKFSIEESLIITKGLAKAVFETIPVRINNNRQYIEIKQIPLGFKDRLKIYSEGENYLYDLMCDGNYYKIEMHENDNGIFEIKSAQEIKKINTGRKILSKPQQMPIEKAKEVLLNFFRKV